MRSPLRSARARRRGDGELGDPSGRGDLSQAADCGGRAPAWGCPRPARAAGAPGRRRGSAQGWGPRELPGSAPRAQRAPPRTRPGLLRAAPVTRLTCVALWNCFLSPATDMVREDTRTREAAAARSGRRPRRGAEREVGRCGRQAAGAVGAGARSGAGRGLVRRDTLTSGAGDAAS